MPTGEVLRILRCRPARSAFDAILRDVLIPDLWRARGIVDLRVARQGPDEVGERVIASVWSTEAAMVESMGSDIEASSFHPEHLLEATDRRLEIHNLAVAFRSKRPRVATILRLSRGRVRRGELARYVDSARLGTREDDATEHGPIALYLADREPDRFVTLSVWDGWPAIEAATGSDVRHPIATRQSDQIVEFEATHFEILPGVGAGPA